MCVICYKPAGTEMPSDETIRQMFTTNPHGAGFAIQGDIDNDGGFKVEFHKGYMTVNALLKALHSRSDMKDLAVAIHTRIKTHGETDPYTTHPFKMSRNFMDTRKTHGRGTVVFHNGIFTGLGGKVDERASDTQDFVTGVASQFLSRPKAPNKLDTAILGQIIGTCRVLIMYPNKDFPCLTFGNWHKHTDGCSYSNMNWEYKAPTSSYNYHSSTTSTSRSLQLDRFKCNIAPYAWPGDSEWIKASSQERFNVLMTQAKDLKDYEDSKGCKIQTCTFTRTGAKIWYVFPRTLELASADGLELMEERDKIADSMFLFGADLDDEVINFEDEDMMLEFQAEATQTSPYTFRFGGKEWYLDTMEMQAFTDEGIKQSFKTGEQGHVKNYLMRYGCTDKYYEGYPTEDDEYNEYNKLGSIANQDDNLFEDDDLPALIEAHAASVQEDEDKKIEKLQEEVDKAYGLA